jgi:predicted secreted protein
MTAVAISTAVAIYFLIWWVVLFAVLPWGVRSQGEAGVPGTDPGAPAVPHLRAKLIWTTLVATVIFGLCAVVYIWQLVTLDDLVRLMGMPL